MAVQRFVGGQWTESATSQGEVQLEYPPYLRMSRISSRLVSVKRLTNERQQSLRVRVVASPKAQSSPCTTATDGSVLLCRPPLVHVAAILVPLTGEGGTMTGQEPMSLATALACTEPAPPKLTRAKSRGS